jgi:hypothetical protein
VKRLSVKQTALFKRWCMASNVHVKFGDAVNTPIGKGVVVAVEDWDVWVKMSSEHQGEGVKFGDVVCFDVSEIERR